MRGKQGVAALVAGALIVLGLLAVFAVELSGNQSQSRRNLERQAHQRAVLTAGLIDAVFEQSAHVNPQQAAAFGAPVVAGRTLQRFRGTNDFAALLSARGALLAHSSGWSAQARRAVLGGRALALVSSGRSWGLGDVAPYGRGGVVDLAELVSTPEGERVFVSGIPLAGLSAFLISELRKVPGGQRQYLTMVDGDHTVVGSTNPARPAGYRLRTPAQLLALTLPSGIFHSSMLGSRYFDKVSLAGTPWVMFVSAPASEFFASVSGFRHWLPWAIFIAFGVVALVALGLVIRAMRSSERIATANSQLTVANVDLGSAREQLVDSNAALADTNAALGRSNEELERQARELVRSNAELDQFASIASHDLQEPLRKVRTFTERIAEIEAGNLSERGLEYLHRANVSAERMQNLIEDLLRYSRVSTQGRPFAPVDLSAIVADVLDALSEQVKRGGTSVRVAELPTINADGSQMRQLMQNLISNALKFRRDGVSPEVRIECEQTAGWLTMTVADNGIGFDQQYAGRIFRVFERLHGRGTYPGTGIGLALCRKIAERHGGTVTATGVPDEGATFTVTLQTERSEAVSDAPAADRPTDGFPQRQEPYVPV